MIAINTCQFTSLTCVHQRISFFTILPRFFFASKSFYANFNFTFIDDDVLMKSEKKLVHNSVGCCLVVCVWRERVTYTSSRSTGVFFSFSILSCLLLQSDRIWFTYAFIMSNVIMFSTFLIPLSNYVGYCHSSLAVL